MNILYLVPNPPSLIRVRPYHLIQGLAARGHRVTVATLWTDDQEAADLRRLQDAGVEVIAAHLGRARIAANLARATVTGLPLQGAYCYVPDLERAVTRQLDGVGAPDLIHVEHLRGAIYGVRLQAALKQRGASIPVIWDSVDCISHLFQQAAGHSRSGFGRFVSHIELERTRRYEGDLAGHFPRVLVTSRVDRTALLALAALTKQASVRSVPFIRVIPNGVDLDYFTCSDVQRSPATIVFSGKMSYHANITAALHLIDDIMPHVWQRCPSAEVVIAGKDPSTEIRERGSRLPNVTVTGTVSDLRPYLQAATVAVSPLLYGAGIQNKVLEAMACGAPVVASSRAVAALDVVNGRDAQVADEPEAFAAQILRVIADPRLAAMQGAAGRRYVEHHHSWNTAVSELERIYREVVAND